MPTSCDPVNVSPSTLPSAASQRPTSSPPTTTCSASGGSPASSSARAISSVVPTPWGGGFTTTVLPAASAAPAGPPDERGREVERGDDGPDAVRAHHVVRRFGRVQALHRLLEPVVLGELVGVVADQVGGLLDVAERLEPALADLEREQRGDAVASLGDQVRAGLEEAHPLRPRGRGPQWREGLRRGHGIGHVPLRRGHEATDQDVGVDRRPLVHHLTGGPLLAADDGAVGAAELGLDLRQAVLERPVDLVALGAQGCVRHSERHGHSPSEERGGGSVPPRPDIVTAVPEGPARRASEVAEGVLQEVGQLLLVDGAGAGGRAARLDPGDVADVVARAPSLARSGARRTATGPCSRAPPAARPAPSHPGSGPGCRAAVAAGTGRAARPG